MTFIPFDDFDSMMEALQQQKERAKSWIKPRQARITYGDYWMSPRDDYGLLIFGRITPRDELDATERRLGASEDEIAYQHEVMDASYADGYRFGDAYSIACPEGELGDTHVSQMAPITEEEFNQARDLKWDPEAIIDLPWYMEAIGRVYGK